jgi:hypothetical protein
LEGLRDSGSSLYRQRQRLYFAAFGAGLCGPQDPTCILNTGGPARGRGRVERFFSTIDQMFLCTLPGFKSSGGKKRLTLAEFDVLCANSSWINIMNVCMERPVLRRSGVGNKEDFCRECPSRTPRPLRNWAWKTRNRNRLERTPRKIGRWCGIHTDSLSFRDTHGNKSKIEVWDEGWRELAPYRTGCGSPPSLFDLLGKKPLTLKGNSGLHTKGKNKARLGAHQDMERIPY